MNQNDVLRAIRKRARTVGAQVHVDTRRGKGSHIRVTVTRDSRTARTTVPRAVGKGLMRAIVGQLSGVLGEDWT